MKAIVLLFDSLNRRLLPPYGATGIHAPSFERLARRTTTFDTCYAGSMPCMPARRELHSGRHNFLHRSWGPLEPFDDSVPEMLSTAGVYTHLTTDHQHYWEDGGATYHNRFDSYEFHRGQEGDAWKGHVADPDDPADGTRKLRHGLWRQDLVNRQYLTDERDHPQTKTVDAGMEFIDTNAREDSWMLQIECFDPHEPFFSYDQYRQQYGLPEYDGPGSDWPDYKRVTEDDETVQRTRAEYAALLTMCDASLGRVLDAMDEHALWDDTMLIVCTDHGFLLGEHGWWGKNVQPWYDENIHTPLFVWDPREPEAAGGRRSALVQTIDFGPTLLDFFGVDPTERMQGRSIAPTLRDDTPVRDSALFGTFGGHVSVTDGRYVYMRACADASNAPLYEHTLMPTHMNARFDPSELASAELVPPLSFTRGAPVLRVPGQAFGNSHTFGTLLFDLAEDPEQQNPLVDDDLELRMANLLLDTMRAADAPESQFERLGLPAAGPARVEHLLAGAQRAHYEDVRLPLPSPSAFRGRFPSVTSPLRELVADGTARSVIESHLGAAPTRMAAVLHDATLLDVAAFTPGLSASRLRALDEALADRA